MSSLTRRLLELGSFGSSSSSVPGTSRSTSTGSNASHATTDGEFALGKGGGKQFSHAAASGAGSLAIPPRFATGAGDSPVPPPPPPAHQHFFFRQEEEAAGGLYGGAEEHKCMSAACQQHRHLHGGASAEGGGRITWDAAVAKEQEAAAATTLDGEETIEDPILMTRIPLSQAYKVNCKCGHCFSTETLYGCIKTAMSDDLIPACPLANNPDEAQRCNYLLTQQEVEQVLNRHAPPSQLPSEERKLWRFRRGRLVDGGLGWVSERVTEAFLRKGKIGAGCMECPNGRCSYWVEPTRPLEKQRVDCPKCLMAFCTLCKRPYHYRCSCDEVMTITKQWLEWQQHGREPYLQQMAAEDSSYQAALDVFNSRRTAHVQEVHTAEQNWGLLVADENYKASRCRRCPHCNRVIERIDGCDTMVCGQNAHGGNIQNGCGQGFDWNEALFYNADIGEKRTIIPFQEVPPPEITRVEHQIMDGTPIACDICAATIRGPLAMCINCPSFSCCIRCQNKHTRGHVLRLYMEGGGDGPPR